MVVTGQNPEVQEDEQAIGVKIGGMRPTAYSDSHKELVKNIDDVTAENLKNKNEP